MKDVTSESLSFIHKLEDAMLKNWGLIAGAFGTLLVAGIAYTGWNYLSEQKELEAQTELFKADQSFSKTMEEAQKKLDETKSTETPKNAKDPKKAEAPKTEQVKVADVDLSKSIDLYNQVLQKYAKTSASVLAAHKISDIYIEKKKYEEAIAPLKSITPSENLLLALTNIKLGSLYEKVGKCDESLKVYNPLAADKKFNFVKPEVLLKTALCYEKLGQADKARETYQKITQEYADSPMAQEADKYLKLLSLNKG